MKISRRDAVYTAFVVVSFTMIAIVCIVAGELR